MCAVCGCGAGEVRIEGRAAAGGGPSHDHGAPGHGDHRHGDHGHDHHHGDHGHDHHHEHAQGGGHDHAHAHDVVTHSHAHDHAHGPGYDHHHDHGHDGHEHDHDHLHDHDHDGHGHAPASGPRHAHAPGLSAARMVEVERNIMARNDAFADANRRAFFDRGVLALNLVSSPGSGKTSLLVETVKRLSGALPVAVIEGDQQTANDAERIRATGAPAIQINTGKGCHLDAHMVGHAFEGLPVAPGGVLFIENVGNLVCPAGFDLGEAHKVVILSVTEGEDKPLKYPDMFMAADLMLLNKTDLLPHLDFDVAACIANARRVNAKLRVLQVSARDGSGMDAWLDWLKAARHMALAGSPALQEG